MFTYSRIRWIRKKLSTLCQSTMKSPIYPRVGVGVIVIRDQKVLLGKRKNAHGEGDWNFPGGHLEFGEEIIACAAREVLEETGLAISNANIGPFTNDVFMEEHKHYITVYVIGDSLEGEAQRLEPEKCEGWQWFSWDNLPQPLFLPIQHLLAKDFSPF